MNFTDVVVASIILYAVGAFASGILASWHLDEDDDRYRPWYVPLFSWPLVALMIVVAMMLLSEIEKLAEE